MSFKNVHRLFLFSEVVKQGSFTKTAESFGHSKSAVSQQISALEKELQLRLFNRSTRQLQLTPHGEIFARRCQELNELLQLSLQEVDDLKRQPGGQFSLTAPHALRACTVLPAIKQLCQQFPALEPKLIISDQIENIIQQGIDMAVRIGHLADSNLKAKRIGTLYEHFYTSPEFLRQHRITQTEDLSKLPCITTPWQTAETLNKVDNFHHTRLNTKFRVNNLPDALDLAQQGMGIAMLPPTYAKTAVKNGLLVNVIPRAPKITRPVSLVHAYNDHLPRHLQILMQLLQQNFSQY